MGSIFKKFLIGSGILLLLLFAAILLLQHVPVCHGSSLDGDRDEALISELQGKNGKAAVDLANRWRLKRLDVVSFVTPEAIHFKFKNGKEISIPLPEDQMMVSIAPYIDTTHPCSTHYISKCDAELKNVPVKVKAVTAGGKELINKTFKSPTGFIDLWLPREQEINLFVSAKGKKAKGKITTYKDSNTCNSTLKLE